MEKDPKYFQNNGQGNDGENDKNGTLKSNNGANKCLSGGNSTGNNNSKSQISSTKISSSNSNAFISLVSDTIQKNPTLSSTIALSTVATTVTGCSYFATSTTGGKELVSGVQNLIKKIGGK
jgi:hypothetical protein